MSSSEPSQVQSQGADQTKTETPLADFLHELGIKVRDFAYESTLPPLKSVHYVPQQILNPRPNPLKRTRGDLEDDEGADEYVPRSLYIEAETGGSTAHARPHLPKKKKPVERTPTEPAEDSESQPRSHTNHGLLVRAALNHSLYLHLDSPPGLSRSTRLPIGPTTPVASTSRHDAADKGQQPPNAQGEESQESEPWIDTPLVTPDGSLQWPVTDNSTVPPSQLDTPSRMPAAEHVTLSQLGFSPERSPFPSQVSANAPDSQSTEPPDVALPSTTPRSPTKQDRLPALFPLAPQGPHGSPRRRASGEASEEARETVSRRYNLRERVVPPLRSNLQSSRSKNRTASSRHEAAGKRVSPLKSIRGKNISRQQQAKGRAASHREGETSTMR